MPSTTLKRDNARPSGWYAPKQTGTYTPGEYRATTDIGKEREQLAAALNWPNDMTLEDLRAEAKARKEFWEIDR